MWIFRVKKETNSISRRSPSTNGQKHKRKRSTSHKGKLKVERSFHAPVLVGCDTGESGDSIEKQECQLKSSESGNPSETLSGWQISVKDLNANAPSHSKNTWTEKRLSHNTDAVQQLSETLNCCQTVKWRQSTDIDSNEARKASKVSEAMVVQRFEIDGTSEHHTAVTHCLDQTTNRDVEKRICSEKMSGAQPNPDFKTLIKDIHEYLDDFYKTYQSFIPLQTSDVLTHLKSKFKIVLSDSRKNFILSEIAQYRASVQLKKPSSSFRVVYKKHTLMVDDLLTLADQNWLNDQIINMYGELIMDAAHHKVHFLNSFFHRQFMTKGYEGVKRWTKKVDLFSKSLLLVPIHLEVHWCLVTVDVLQRKICLYDSQGNATMKVARNILKYLIKEAKEKKQTAFENTWTVSFDEKVPQQTNENDCGVFVLEYSRCLALRKPLQFSQNDIPKIRRRIYKELCECKLNKLD